MNISLFIDTNVLLSGIFFRGSEAHLLDTPGIRFITCEDAVSELHGVIRRKLRYLGERTLEIALQEAVRALDEFDVIYRVKYQTHIAEACRLIPHAKDGIILAAALYSKADVLVTGDRHFSVPAVTGRIRVATAGEIISLITRR